ncbi:2Fe-2S iron-sulfur cluster-binding protein [Pseudarthrobacter oxydans]|uniref:2Fe-2S iron-sulfur cluster-binding protein n=1 Tax=Pseudarthrobacter oxydans TaxID=1671 RepID=UPI0037F9C8BB
MPRINFVQPDGDVSVIDAEPGTSVMHVALFNDVTGIVAECGGNAMCATCHVYVEEKDLDQLPEMAPDEDEMLNCTASPRESNSRLSCQIQVPAGAAGITVQVPEHQV